MGAVPTLRLQWDASAAAAPAGVGHLHLLVRATGASFVAVGTRCGSKESPMKDWVRGQATVALAALRGAAAVSSPVQRSTDATGRETELVLKVKDLPLVHEGRPVLYPPGSTDQLRVDVTIRVHR
jgi:hypothetical protein